MTGELTRWKPFEGLTTLRRDMDRLWDRFIGDDWMPSRERNGWSPALNLSETKNNLIVKTEIAGVDPKEVNISVTGDVLSIKGEKKEEKEEKDENYHLMESSYGYFSRTVRLPVEVEQEKIKASCKNGVLKITLPKSTKSKAKEIKIDVEK
jgi:HSP20 family protein